MDYTGNIAVSISAVGMATLTADDILRWVYMGLAIISILIPLIAKIIDAIDDHKVTKDELNDIKNEVDKAKDEISEVINNEKNDD